jgi:hypothetical protein
VICFVFIGPVYGQVSHVQEIKRKSLYNGYITDSTIIYPLVSYTNKAVSNRINAQIRKEFFEVYEVDEKMPLKAAIDSASVAGLTDLSYDISYDSKAMLSLQLTIGATGAYPSVGWDYFNFNAHGNRLTIDSIILPGKLKLFLAKVKKQEIENLKLYKADLKKQLAAKEIDSDEYNTALDIVKNYCWDNYRNTDFKITSDGISVIVDCDFPHVILALAPDNEVKFMKSELKEFLKPEYRL